jgi:hypothetical protein
VEVLVRPGNFFRVGVAPGDQAPGLAFAVAVAVAYVVVLFVVEPARVPRLADAGVVVSGAATLLAVALLIAPAVLHLAAALGTVALVVLDAVYGLVGVDLPERGGVSETVQVLAYATAPCALASIPVLELRVLATLYGAALLVVGFREVHDAGLVRAAAAAALPGTLVFGYAFGGVAAAERLLVAWALV